MHRREYGLRARHVGRASQPGVEPRDHVHLPPRRVRHADAGGPIAASADAGTLALVTDGRIVVGPTAPLLALVRAPGTGPVLPPGDLVRGGIALDEDGGLRAVAVEAGDSGPSQIAVYVRDGGTWRAGTRITPPVSATDGWLAWLR